MNLRHTVGAIIMLTIPSVALAQQVGFSCGAQSGLLYRVSIPSGQIDAMGDGSLAFVQSFAISRNGDLYGFEEANTWELKRVDTATGNAATIGTVTVSANQHPVSVSFDGEDRLLLLANSQPQSALYEVDTSNAGTSFVISIDSSALIRFAVRGSSCFALDYLGRLFSVDLVTGAVTGLSGSSTSAVKDISFDRAGQLWGMEAPADPWNGCTDTYLVRFDLATGEFFRIAQIPDTNGDCLWALAIQSDQPAAVPAHGVFGSVLMGLLIALVGATMLVAGNSHLL